MPMSAFCCDHRLDDVAAVFLDQRVRLVVGEACRRSRSTGCVVLQGSRSKSFGATRPAMPLPASSTTLNGLTSDGSMNDITCST